MQTSKRNAILRATALLAALNLALGFAVWPPLIGVGGSLGLIYVLDRVVQAHRAPGGSRRGVAPPPSDETPRRSPQDTPAPSTASNDADRLVETVLAQGRCALLLRPQIAQGLSDDLFRRALQHLADATALVPEGEVLLRPLNDPADNGDPEAAEAAASLGRVVCLEPFFLDRYPVTNAHFYEFVAAGGYQEAALWDATILPAVLDFVDRTGEPGPRFWSGGRYDPAMKDHPVVGVSWYEAAAFARWAGKRLPTDAEWVKAASWPVSLSVGAHSQRRYPWGDTMDRTRANLWGSGPKGTAPVTAFAGGVSVGSVYQLVGNVWEWMRGDFPLSDAGNGEWIIDTPMKNIRGGAFDTYFDIQATCQFQSGEAAIARKQNIGFRCAVGVCDLLLARTGRGDAPATPAPTILPEEAPV